MLKGEGIWNAMTAFHFGKKRRKEGVKINILFGKKAEDKVYETIEKTLRL